MADVTKTHTHYIEVQAIEQNNREKATDTTWVRNNGGPGFLVATRALHPLSELTELKAEKKRVELLETARVRLQNERDGARNELTNLLRDLSFNIHNEEIRKVLNKHENRASSVVNYLSEQYASSSDRARVEAVGKGLGRTTADDTAGLRRWATERDHGAMGQRYTIEALARLVADALDRLDARHGGDGA